MASNRPRHTPDPRVSMYTPPYRMQRRSFWRWFFDLLRGL